MESAGRGGLRESRPRLTRVAAGAGAGAVGAVGAVGAADAADAADGGGVVPVTCWDVLIVVLSDEV